MHSNQTRTLMPVCLILFAWATASRGAGKEEVIFADEFAKPGAMDAQKWQIVHGKPPRCEAGTLINARNKIWNSKQTFAEPITVEFSGVYLGALPTSGANALGLSPGGWGKDNVCWDFDGSRRPAKGLVPFLRKSGKGDWRRAYKKEVDLTTLPDITKKENAVNLRIDWWPGKVVRYYLNGRLAAHYTEGVPGMPLPVGVRDETVAFRIGGIKVTRNTTPVTALLEEIRQAEIAAAKAEKEAFRRAYAASMRRLAAHVTAMSDRTTSRPQYALLLHMEGGDKARDSSVHRFELNCEGVSYGPGRFGRAAKFDGLRSRMILDKPMIERPGYQYLSLCFPKQTVECWIRPERTGTAETILGAVRWFNPHDPGHKMEGWQLLRDNDGAIVFDWGSTRIRSAAQAPVNTWTHIAASVDVPPGKAALFLNGQLNGTASVGAIRTGGKFLIGAGDAGFFKGSIDEVVIHLNALSAGEIADRAKAAAVHDPKIEPRFYALPANDHTFIFLSHGDLPGNWLLLRLPEYAFRDPNGRVHEARLVRWTWEAGAWTYTWAVSEEKKKQTLLDFRGRIMPGADRVLYALESVNPGAKKWHTEQMNYACMRCADAPLFHDFDATRTFVRKQGRFITVLDAMGGKLHVNKTGDSRVGGAPGRLFSRISTDRRWVLGIITDSAKNTAGNFAPLAFCMHSNPVWGRLEPGESRTAWGFIYLKRGGPADLWKQVEKDFGRWEK